MLKQMRLRRLNLASSKGLLDPPFYGFWPALPNVIALLSWPAEYSPNVKDDFTAVTHQNLRR